MTRVFLYFLLGSLAQAQTLDMVKKTAVGTINKMDYAIGDLDRKGEFEARARLAFWDDEESFELEMEGVKGTPQVVGDTIVLPWTSDSSMEFVANETALKWKFKFDTKPSSNVYTMQLGGKWTEFDFFYQTPFTSPTSTFEDGVEYLEQDMGDGMMARRMRKVDGSYAVYHKTKRDHALGGTNYRCGKVCHIYVPKATDAIGNHAWCILHIDTITGAYSVTVPQNFLNEAVYPIVVNDELGESGEGASTQAWSPNRFIFTEGYAGVNGTATAVSVYITDGNGRPCTSGFYSGATSLTRVADTAEWIATNNVEQWWEQSLDSSVGISSGTTYHVGFCCGTNSLGAINYDSVASVSDWVDDTYVAGVLLASHTFGSDFAFRWSMHIDYTPTASAGGQFMFVTILPYWLVPGLIFMALLYRRKTA